MLFGLESRLSGKHCVLNLANSPPTVSIFLALGQVLSRIGVSFWFFLKSIRNTRLLAPVPHCIVHKTGPHLGTGSKRVQDEPLAASGSDP